MPDFPDSTTLTDLRTWLRRGRYDYDWVADRIYAACYNDPNVMQKILAASPRDVPSSASASEESSEAKDEDEASEEDHAEPPILNGSKENPVVLEDETEDGAMEGGLGKRKRPMSGVEDSTIKKPKKPEELLLCLNCGRKFDPEKNKDGKCRYHPSETVLGELEDNPTNDDISDDEDSRETWPNAFQWECCDTNFEETDVAPCETGRHRSGQGERTEYAMRQVKERRRTKLYG